MTRQIGDGISHRGKTYSIQAASRRPLFRPEQFNLHPKMASTACWAGYSADYAIVEDKLVLDILEVYLEEEAAVINGIMPEKCHPESDFNYRYEGLNLSQPYNGGLLIASGYLGFGLDIGNPLYDMGDPPEWHYEQIIELTFWQGQLVAEEDRSNRMRELRQAHIQQRTATGDISYPSLEGEFRHRYPN